MKLKYIEQKGLRKLEPLTEALLLIKSGNVESIKALLRRCYNNGYLKGWNEAMIDHDKQVSNSLLRSLGK